MRKSLILIALASMVVGGCASDAGDEDADDADTTSAMLASRGLARYDFSTFDREGGERNNGAVFRGVDRIPSLGTYVVEMFIPNGRERVFPGTYLRGDGRSFDSNFDPHKARGYLVLDFVSGKAWMGMNESHLMLCNEAWPHSCQTIHTNAPHATQYSFGNGDNRFFVDWVDHNTVRVRLKGTVSTPGPTEWAACSLDHELLIDARNGTVRHEGDGFPSLGIYRYAQGSSTPRTALRVSAGSPQNLCGNPSYSTPRRALAAHRP